MTNVQRDRYSVNRVARPILLLSPLPRLNSPSVCALRVKSFYFFFSVLFFSARPSAVLEEEMVHRTFFIGSSAAKRFFRAVHAGTVKAYNALYRCTHFSLSRRLYRFDVSVRCLSVEKKKKS